MSKPRCLISSFWMLLPGQKVVRNGLKPVHADFTIYKLLLLKSVYCAVAKDAAPLTLCSGWSKYWHNLRHKPSILRKNFDRLAFLALLTKMTHVWRDLEGDKHDVADKVYHT